MHYKLLKKSQYTTAITNSSNGPLENKNLNDAKWEQQFANNSFTNSFVWRFSLSEGVRKTSFDTQVSTEF